MLTVEQVGDALVVVPRGEFDISNSQILHAAIGTAMKAEFGKIVVSFEHCRYIDSSVLTILAEASRTIGWQVSIALPPDSPTFRIFAVTHFDLLVPIFPSVDDALDMRDQTWINS